MASNEIKAGTAFLSLAPRQDRAPISRMAKGLRVESGGGKFGAGIIRRYSVITRGEALGHDAWIDGQCLQQVADLLNARPNGVKSRFTHPDLSADGMGTLLGRSFNAVIEGDQVLADLHLEQSSHATPDGDLGGYVMQLADEDPEAFGTSIVFLHDFAAEDEFIDDHRPTDEQGRRQPFESPDADNVHNFYHVRVRQLLASDVVDEPAANPGGLFHQSNNVLKDAEALAEFAVGLSKETPKMTALSQLNPDRVAGFVSKFLSSHGLTLAPKEGKPMSTKTDVTNEPQIDPRAEFQATLQKFTARFGESDGSKWASEGLSYEAALEKFCDKLQASLTAKTGEVEQLQKDIAETKVGADEPAEFKDGEKSQTNSFKSCFRISGKKAA